MSVIILLIMARTLFGVDVARNALYADGMILIALGANLPHPDLGPPPAVFNAALAELDALGLRLTVRSKLYQGKAVGLPGQPDCINPDYINAVIALDGRIVPHLLLRSMLRIEVNLGRIRDVRWGPRTLDMDLIAHGRHVLPGRKVWRRAVKHDEGKALILPHPRAHLREFVLRPLGEILPDWRHPVLGKSAADLLSGMENTLISQPWV